MRYGQTLTGLAVSIPSEVASSLTNTQGSGSNSVPVQSRLRAVEADAAVALSFGHALDVGPINAVQ